MTKERAYFKEVKEKIKPFAEVIYFEPIDEQEVQKLENEWNIQLKPILREFILNFGFQQDVFKKFQLEKEEIEENLDSLTMEKLNKFFPLKTKLNSKTDQIIAINNEDLNDNHIYVITIDEDSQLNRIKKKKTTFIESLENEVNKITINRCKNSDKIRIGDFIIRTSNLDNILLGLKEANINQLTNWVDKYYPVNPFGAKIAKFELFNRIQLVFELDETEQEYKFEIEEPLLTKKHMSLIEKINELLKVSSLNFEYEELGIIENE